MIVHKTGAKDAIDGTDAELLDAVQLPKGTDEALPARAVRWTAAAGNLARALVLGARSAGRGRADQCARRLGAGVRARPVRGTAAGRCGFACLFISHDLAVVDRSPTGWRCCGAAVVELGQRDAILRDPAEEYTKRLIAAIPVPDPAEQRRRREARGHLLTDIS